MKEREVRAWQLLPGDRPLNDEKARGVADCVGASDGMVYVLWADGTWSLLDRNTELTVVTL